MSEAPESSPSAASDPAGGGGGPARPAREPGRTVPVWRGHMVLGLLQIPSALVVAETGLDPRLVMLDSRDHARVRYERVNADTGEEVPWDQVVKGFEYDDGSYVILTEGELEAAAPRATRVITISAFTPREAISPAFFDRPYYIVPDPGGEKAYAALREALRRTRRVALATAIVRTRQYLCAVYPEGDVLILNTLRYLQELRPPVELPSAELRRAESELTPGELDMATRLLDSLTIAWDPSQYRDEYRDQLLRFIRERIPREPAAVPPPPPAPSTYPDLLEILRRSLPANGPALPPGMTPGRRALGRGRAAG